MVRFLLLEAAQVTVRRLPEWRGHYLHLLMRRGRKIAKVAMARKLAVALYWMWRKSWNYEPSKGSVARGPARNRRWCAVEHRAIEWAARSSSRRSSK
jgi:hypothetical protein